MKVLVTGFDPFGEEQINPAYEAVKLLPDQIAGAKIIKLQIPTTFSGSVAVTEDAIIRHQPDIVINVGQAGGRSCITVEKVAINLAEARIPDNDGMQPSGDPLQAAGDTAYFATIPVKAIVSNVRAHGLPCHISYTAGTYVCNCIMYNVLFLAATKYPHIRAGFIHVPYACEQVINKTSGTPYMSVSDMAAALKYAIEAAVENKTDLCEIMGTTH